MDELERKYWDYIRFTKLTLSMTGIWPCGTKRIDKIDQKISWLCIILSILLGLSVLYFCRHHFYDLEILMKGISLFFTILLMFVKLVSFVKNRDGIAKIADDLGLLSTDQMKDPKLQPFILGLFPVLRRYCYVQGFTVASAIILYSVTPVMIILYQKLSGVYPITYIYPYPVKFPWDVDGECGILYVAHYIFSLLIGWICFSSVVGTDAMFCLFVLHICGQLRILKSNFASSLSQSDDSNNLFREWMERHCLLARCLKGVQKVFGSIILTQLTSNGLIMCSLIFQASQMKVISVGKAITFIFYFAAKFVQALMYGWCGSLLTTESEAVSYSAYDSDWINLSNPKMMRNVLMVLCQRPFVLTACRFTDVSMNMLTAILNTAVSYYFLLKTVEEK